MRALLQRAETVEGLVEGVVDLLVVGGGIVGAGIARDAALRGLRTALVEQYDFASGTSSRSSRLLHGGLRYLAQGRLGLVREASVEKAVIHRIAPHLAESLAFVFPTYRGNRDWVLWQLKIGVKIYDLLCGGHNLGNSGWLRPDELRDKIPALTAQGLKGAVRYFDAFTNDARLTIDTLRSAAVAGASVLNYCRFLDARRSEFWECDLNDCLSGRRLRLRARSVVNATGPWAEGLPHSRVKLRVTKGIHLVVERARVPVPEAIVMTAGKRILFAIPWGERTILGTTDTDYQGLPEEVRAEDSDVAYVLGITNRFFPGANLAPRDVIGVWAGLRPLVADPNGNPSDISRSHEIRNPEPGWWDVTGGKLTTYRLMAEQTVDQIVKTLKKSNAGNGIARCRTAEEPLLPASEISGSGILPPEYTRRVVEHYCAREWAVHLEDVMVRRSSWHYYFPDASQVAERVSGWMAELLDWPEQTRRAELDRYRILIGLPIPATPALKSRPAASLPA